MKLEPLFNLKNQLENALIAGTRFVGDNFRLKNSIAEFDELSKVNPVFAKIKANCDKIFNSENVNADILSTLALVKAVAYTQSDVGVEDISNLNELETEEKDYENIPSFFLELLDNPHASDAEVLISNFEVHPEYLNDFRALTGYSRVVKHYARYGNDDYAKALKKVLADFLQNHPNKEEFEKKIAAANVLGDLDIRNKILYRYYGVADTIEIPEGVTEIRNSAFYNSSIKNVKLPSSLKIICADAFRNCTQLESITFPSNLKSIHNHAFFNCYALKKIEIPESVHLISSSAFANCVNLEEIKLNDKVEVKDFAFINCKIQNYKSNTFEIKDGLVIKDNTIEYFTSPDFKIPSDSNIEIIGDEAFSCCSSISTFKIPANVKIIGERAFSHCVNLTEITIPENVKKIKSFTFKDCSSLKKVIIHNDLKEIEYCAFEYCSSLETIEGFENVENLNSWCFYSCKNLKSLKISPKLKYSYGAFSYCPKLDSATKTALNNIGYNL